MSVEYDAILRQIALRINAVLGTTAAQLETAYTVTPLTDSEVNSPIFPFTSIVDLVLLAEGRFVNAIANSAHPYRSYLRGLTSAIANRTALPTNTSTGVPVVGIPGSVYDSSDGTPCVKRPLREVTIRSANAGSFFKSAAYWYNINGATVYHTRTNVIIEVCKYDESAQRAAIIANDTMLLADDLEAALVDEGLRQAFRDDEFIQQANSFGAISDQWLAKFQPVMAAAA